MTGRSLPEWIGKTSDSPIPERVKLRVLLRYDGRCYKTHHKFRAGDVIEFDHIVAIINGGENRESNIAPILGDRHKQKTAEDVKLKSKTAKTKAKHLGIKPKSRGFWKPKGSRYDWARGRYVFGDDK